MRSLELVLTLAGALLVSLVGLALTSVGKLLVRSADRALRHAAREDGDSGVRKAELPAAPKIEVAYEISP
jgi:hypothetical protein